MQLALHPAQHQEIQNHGYDAWIMTTSNTTKDARRGTEKIKHSIDKRDLA